MPTRNVNLTEELDRFVLSSIETGRYKNASEVVRAALRSLERDAQAHEAKLARLRTAIDEGDASGKAEPGVFSRPPPSPAFRKQPVGVATVEFSQNAEADLLDIGLYILSMWGASQTLKYINEMGDACQRLADFPTSGRLCEHIRPGLRRMEQARHVIFYRVSENGILVSRILHERMLRSIVTWTNEPYRISPTNTPPSPNSIPSSETPPPT